MIIQPSSSEWTFGIVLLHSLSLLLSCSFPPHCSEKDKKQVHPAADPPSVLQPFLHSRLKQCCERGVLSKKVAERWGYVGVREQSRSVSKGIIKPVHQSYTNSSPTCPPNSYFSPFVTWKHRDLSEWRRQSVLDKLVSLYVRHWEDKLFFVHRHQGLVCILVYI